ncbi:hypothetical protein [Brevibacterium litoralis]|uniref:hypothetical protein n=1 Tax=Brevibacterium litoralis TaxID=3138935 RepID=UPI0032EEB56B
MDPFTLGAGFGLGALVLGLICLWACRKIARGKNRSTFWWGLWGFLATWIALIIVAVLPDKSHARY